MYAYIRNHMLRNFFSQTLILAIASRDYHLNEYKFTDIKSTRGYQFQIGLSDKESHTRRTLSNCASYESWLHRSFNDSVWPCTTLAKSISLKGRTVVLLAASHYCVGDNASCVLMHCDNASCVTVWVTVALAFCALCHARLG